MLFALAAMVIAPRATAADKTYLVGFAQDNMANKWRAEQVFALERALAKNASVKFIYTDAKGDAAKAVKDIEDLRDMGVDMLVVSPLNPVLLDPVISSLYQSGTPVILLTRKVISDNYTSFIGADDVAIGAMAADAIAESTGGRGRILMIQGLPSASTVAARTQGFLDRLQAHPSLHVDRMVPANYLRGDAIKIMGELLDKGEVFDAIYAQSDSMAEGARIALRAHGIDPKSIAIVGIDYIREAQMAIKKGEQYASFTYPNCTKEAAAVIFDLIAGRSVKKNIMVHSQKITAHNVSAVEVSF